MRVELSSLVSLLHELYRGYPLAPPEVITDFDVGVRRCRSVRWGRSQAQFLVDGRPPFWPATRCTCAACARVGYQLVCGNALAPFSDAALGGGRARWRGRSCSRPGRVMANPRCAPRWSIRDGACFRMNSDWCARKTAPWFRCRAYTPQERIHRGDPSLPARGRDRPFVPRHTQRYGGARAAASGQRASRRWKPRAPLVGISALGRGCAAPARAHGQGRGLSDGGYQRFQLRGVGRARVRPGQRRWCAIATAMR